MIKDLGCTSNIAVLNQLVSIVDQFLVDAGCGGLTFAQELLEQGARVLAIDPDPVQAKLNRSLNPIDGIEFVETGAEQIPAESGTVDGVVFAYSLHHIPAAIYPQVFAEVLRVLKPSGFLYVIEPSDCPLNDVTNLFHDEDEARAAAWQALEELAIPAFISCDIVKYHDFRQYESFDHFANQYGSKSFNTNYTEADVRHPEVREAFERLGGSDYRFVSPKQVMFLQGLKSQV